MNENKKVTFKFPFDINPNFFLGLALLFFIITIKPINNKLFPRVTPQNLKPLIEKDIINNVKLFKEISKDSAEILQLVQTNVDENKLNKYLNLPFVLFIYSNNNVVFWNTHEVTYPLETFKNETLSLYKDNLGYYVSYKKTLSKDISLLALIKIKTEELSNREIPKKFFNVSDQENDFGIDVVAEKTANNVSVDFRGSPVFYLEKNDDFFIINDSNGWRLFLNMLPFIIFGISIHTYFKVIIKKTNPLKVYGFLLTTILVIRSLSYFFEFPTNYDEYTLFSPEIYADSFLNKSLGDLFINISLAFWALLFYSINVQGEFKENKFFNNPVKGGTLIIISSFLNIYFAYLITSVINNSVINFDTTLISQINIFSIVGLLVFLIVFANIFTVTIITHTYLKNCFKNIYYKYLILFFVFLVFIFFIKTYSIWTVLFVFVSMNLYFIFHDSKYFKIKLDFNSYTLLLWLMLLSFLGALYLSKVVSDKEVLTRKDFAEKFLQIEDKKLETQLQNFSNIIKKDEELIQLIKNGNHSSTNHEIDNYIYDNYLNLHFKNYKKGLRFHIAPKYGFLTPVEFIDEKRNIKYENPKIVYVNSDSSIFQFRKMNEKGYILSFDFIVNGENLGYLFCKFSSKSNVVEKDYADFLYPNNLRNKFKEYNNSIAIYNESVFEYRIGNDIFPYNIDSLTFNKIKESEYLFTGNFSKNKLWIYNDELNKVVVVSKNSNYAYHVFTVFAYIFFIYFSILSLYILGNILARSNLNYSRFINLLSLNLRLRIHFSILLVVFLSFWAVGYFTFNYLINRSVIKSYTEISNYGQLLVNKVNSYFAESKTERDSSLYNSNSDDMNFEMFLTDEANKYAKGVSVFSIQDGGLFYTSQPEFYNSKVVSDKIPFNVFLQLKSQNIDHVLNKEKISDFSYIAMYSFIQNNKGEKIAILQMPYFSSEKEARDETSTILITLINIYVFVFLLSSIVALILSNSVTKPFKYIVKQFTKINLSKTNEPLKWNNSDEIGLLVKEYNRMLRKLENNTVLLAKSEREMAWREMAKQVAHEIKNPLTPMKLSLQMLERVIKLDKPNVREMTEKVTTTLIEQIDNLSLIATNFSSFAKLPELSNEIVKLNDVLYSVTGMYMDDKNAEYLFLIPDYPIFVYADKSQLIRVFTNIIQNAIQAIPINKKGNISLVLSKIKDDFVRITIADNGDGISDERASKLFQPYFTTKSSGTGLGLAMCKDIIEKSNGKISFESVVGEGTLFHIDLPIVNE